MKGFGPVPLLLKHNTPAPPLSRIVVMTPAKVTQEEDVSTPGYGRGFVSECPISREADHAVELMI